jgi:hypothetical protein
MVNGEWHQLPDTGYRASTLNFKINCRQLNPEHVFPATGAW